MENHCYIFYKRGKANNTNLQTKVGGQINILITVLVSTVNLGIKVSEKYEEAKLNMQYNERLPLLVIN